MKFKLIDKHVYLVEALDKYDLEYSEVVLAGSMKEAIEIMKILTPVSKLLKVSYICGNAYESEAE